MWSDLVSDCDTDSRSTDMNKDLDIDQP